VPDGGAGRVATVLNGRPRDPITVVIHRINCRSDTCAPAGQNLGHKTGRRRTYAHTYRTYTVVRDDDEIRTRKLRRIIVVIYIYVYVRITRCGSRTPSYKARRERGRERENHLPNAKRYYNNYRIYTYVRVRSFTRRSRRRVKLPRDVIIRDARVPINHKPLARARTR